MDVSKKTHLRLRCNCNVTNRNIIVIIGDYGLWTSVEPSSPNRTLCSPINKLCQSHKSFFQFFLICNFFFFAEVLWGFILPPAVSLSRILWELAFLSKKDPPLRIAKKSLIVSWWSWWESHPCLKSYWTTSLPLLTEGIDSVIFSILWGLKTSWANLYPTISDSHILVLVTYKS